MSYLDRDSKSDFASSLTRCGKKILAFSINNILSGENNNNNSREREFESSKRNSQSQKDQEHEHSDDEVKILIIETFNFLIDYCRVIEISNFRDNTIK